MADGSSAGWRRVGCWDSRRRLCVDFSASGRQHLVILHLTSPLPTHTFANSNPQNTLSAHLEPFSRAELTSTLPLLKLSAAATNYLP
jgi:hypothetical protein